MTGDDVRRYFAMAPLAAAIIVGAIGFAEAQTVSDGQSCGGLVCDLGIFGHKTAPSETDTKPIAPSPATAPARAAAMPAEPKAHKVRPAKRIAKAVPAQTAPAQEAVAVPAQAAVAPSAPAVIDPAVVPAPVATAGTRPTTSASTGPAASAAAIPAKDEVYIRSNPYTTGLPTPTLIIPIGPAPPPD